MRGKDGKNARRTEGCDPSGRYDGHLLQVRLDRIAVAFPERPKVMSLNVQFPPCGITVPKGVLWE